MKNICKTPIEYVIEIKITKNKAFQEIQKSEGVPFYFHYSIT